MAEIAGEGATETELAFEYPSGPARQGPLDEDVHVCRPDNMQMQAETRAPGGSVARRTAFYAMALDVWSHYIYAYIHS